MSEVLEELSFDCWLNEFLEYDESVLPHSRSVSFFDLNPSITCLPSKIQSNLEPQTQPQLQLQQQFGGLDLENFLGQFLLLSATDVIETQLQRINHYFEEWKKTRRFRSGLSIPSSYSEMVHKLHKSQLSPRFNEATDYVESEFLRDLERRGYGHATELKELLRQDLTVYLTKAKGEGGRNGCISFADLLSSGCYGAV